MYDTIYVMDRMNLKDVSALARNSEDLKKVKLLLGDEIVPDPYYDDTMFAPVYQMIERACKAIISKEVKS